MFFRRPGGAPPDLSREAIMAELDRAYGTRELPRGAPPGRTIRAEGPLFSIRIGGWQVMCVRVRAHRHT